MLSKGRVMNQKEYTILIEVSHISIWHKLLVTNLHALSLSISFGYNIPKFVFFNQNLHYNVCCFFCLHNQAIFAAKGTCIFFVGLLFINLNRLATFAVLCGFLRANRQRILSRIEQYRLFEEQVERALSLIVYFGNLMEFLC